MKIRDSFSDDGDTQESERSQFTEKRKYKRVSISVGEQLNAVLFHSGKYALVRGLDISAGGLSASMIENTDGMDLSEGDIVDMHMVFGGSSIYPLKSRVVRKGNTRLGLEYIEPTMLSKVALSDYIERCSS